MRMRIAALLPALAAALAFPLALAPAAAAASGATWTITPVPNPGTFPSLLGIAASSATDAWNVGYFEESSGAVYHTLTEHWNGTAWTQVASPGAPVGVNILKSVADLSSTNAWAVGYSEDDINDLAPQQAPLIEHWNGRAWSIVPAAADPNGAQDTLAAVAATGASDVWAVGEHFDAAVGGNDGLVEHWDGIRWALLPGPQGASTLTAVTAISSTDVWVAGTAPSSQPFFGHWNGQAWTSVSSPAIAGSTDVTALAATGPADVWAAGYQRANVRRAPYQTLVEHWDGKAWTVLPSPNPSAISDLLLGLAALSPGDAWAVGYQYLSGGGAASLAAHWDGSAWTAASTPQPSGATYTELAGAAALRPGTVWVAARAGYEPFVLHTTNG